MGYPLKRLNTGMEYPLNRLKHDGIPVKNAFTKDRISFKKPQTRMEYPLNSLSKDGISFKKPYKRMGYPLKRLKKGWDTF